jgi:lysophospholipase L1-like esterase
MKRLLAALTLLTFASLAGADEPPARVEPMKEVHAKFTGTPGTLALLGDSITVSQAFWSPLLYAPKELPAEVARPLAAVKGYMKEECWAKWRGARYGNDGGQTAAWAEKNVGKWLEKLNPECAVVMFGTNDLSGVDAKTYDRQMRAVVEACLKNGTVVILTTIPPRAGHEEMSKEFAEVVRKVAADFKLPLIDYQAEILKRRPNDWNGALPKFKEFGKDVYQVPTLVSGDGVHPSYPRQFSDYSDDALKSNGYQLRTVLTLQAYADVITRVFAAKK